MFSQSPACVEKVISNAIRSVRMGFYTLWRKKKKPEKRRKSLTSLWSSYLCRWDILSPTQEIIYLQIFAYIVENWTETTPAKSKICCSVSSSLANSAARPLMSAAVIVAANWPLQKLSLIPSSSAGEALVTISSILGKVSSWFIAKAVEAKTQLAIAITLRIDLYIFNLPIFGMETLIVLRNRCDNFMNKRYVKIWWKVFLLIL